MRGSGIFTEVNGIPSWIHLQHLDAFWVTIAPAGVSRSLASGAVLVSTDVSPNLHGPTVERLAAVDIGVSVEEFDSVIVLLPYVGPVPDPIDVEVCIDHWGKSS